MSVGGRTYGRNSDGNPIPVAEILGEYSIRLPDKCLLECQAAKDFVASVALSSAADIIVSQGQEISLCSGPQVKSFGRIACGVDC